MYNKKTYCPMPFVTMTVNPGNYISRCMMSHESMGEIESKTLQNPAFKTLRSNMLNGVWDKEGCKVCYNRENANLDSQRLKWLKNEKKYLDEDGLYEKNINLSRNKIYHLYLNFSNICNFKCRMCGPHFSNAWLSDHNKLLEKGLYKEIYNTSFIIPPKSQVDIDKFLLEFGNDLKDLRQIWITGGEPFIDNKLFDFFEKLGSYADLKNIKVSINTNGSKLDVNKLKILRNLKQIVINFSVDAVGDLYKYMRGYNYDFNEIDKKINHCLKLQNEQDNLNIAVNGTYQLYNILNVEDFWLWGKKVANSKEGNWIEYRTLSGPNFLAARHAPLTVKNKAVKILQKLIDDDKEFSHNHYLQQAICECKLNAVPEYIKKFVNFNDALDNIRNEKINDYCEFLYKGWSEEGNLDE
jgi:organic radical activating enzyme